MTITTPSGHEVTIKDAITYGEKRRITRIFLKAAKTGAGSRSGQVVLDDSSVLQDAEDEAIRIMVSSIKTAGSDSKTVTTPNEILDTILGWLDADANAVISQINEITSPVAESPKEN